MRKTASFILAKVTKSLFSDSLKNDFRINSTDFSRKRVQSFSGTIIFMINLLRKSLVIEIENFVKNYNDSCPDSNMKSFTESAFVQYRKKINPKVFRHLSNVLINEFYTDNDLAIKRWKGFRLLAVDGSSLTLPNTEELASHYGVTKNQTKNGQVQGRISVLYDVLNNYVLDAKLSPLKIGEGKLAIKHLKKCNPKDLIIYDRGYTGFPLIHKLDKSNVDFVIRAKVGFSNQIKAFVNTGLNSEIIEIKADRKKSFIGLPYTRQSKIKVRLVKVDLGKGKFEILITSLLDESTYSYKIFKDLYFQRWGVETYYDELKNKLKVENFSGYSKQVIEQDFEASIFISNVQSLIVGELNNELEEKPNKKIKKYEYKINTAVSYGLLRNRIISLFLNPKESENVVDELKKIFKKHLIPIRPNRKLERNTEKYRREPKPKVTKNQRDTF
jgi:hypothetical protein